MDRMPLHRSITFLLQRLMLLFALAFPASPAWSQVSNQYTNATSGANNTANNSPNGAGVGNRHIASSKASAP